MRKGAYWGIGLFVLVLSLCAVFPADAGMIGLFSPSSEEDRRIAEVVLDRVEQGGVERLLAEANDALNVSATAKRRGYQISAAKLAFACMVYSAGIIHENENMRIQYEDIVTDTFTHAVMLLGFTSGDDVAVAVRQCQESLSSLQTRGSYAHHGGLFSLRKGTLLRYEKTRLEAVLCRLH
ncbi:hypothetical protein [Bilophila wadsworthia]|uniref:hypothetical protein n=1 Tax=Bilophila wadsworthia TaxID=35833 RepID=UPI00300F37B7